MLSVVITITTVQKQFEFITHLTLGAILQRRPRGEGEGGGWKIAKFCG